MLYLCGWSEPEGIFVGIHKDSGWDTCLFVRPRDTKSEIWEGIRIGVEGASEGWPVSHSSSIENIGDEIPEMLANANEVFAISGLNSKIDEFLDDIDISDPRKIIDKHRIFKSPAEIEIMRQSSILATSAHNEAMSKSHGGVGEWEIQSIIEGHFIKHKSQWSYPSIVGGGDNATILHYNRNSCSINDGDLVLVDAGCEIHGYASDVTRTWPVNGKFTEPQREIYELVLKAELAGIEACQVGLPWLSMHKATSEVLAAGMVDLGILDCTLEEAIGNDFDGPYRNFFMHGTGHFLGLDVHDVGGGRVGDDDKGPELQPGMVVTVEPGLYFGSWRTDVSIPERYSGIGVRIEDDVLITDNGPVVLTDGCPKLINEIESLVGTHR
jgi:Xaa-Pro aminopeptidase